MFRFPEPGELSNPSGIPISEDDAYWLLLASGPVLARYDLDADYNPECNAALLAWWNLMNALPKDKRVICQKIIRAQCNNRLPDAPWEDVDSQGNPF